MKSKSFTNEKADAAATTPTKTKSLYETCNIVTLHNNRKQFDTLQNRKNMRKCRWMHISELIPIALDDLCNQAVV